MRILMDNRNHVFKELDDGRRLVECNCGKTLLSLVEIEGKHRAKLMLDPPKPFHVWEHLEDPCVEGCCLSCKQKQYIYFVHILKILFGHSDILDAFHAEGFSDPEGENSLIEARAESDPNSDYFPEYWHEQWFKGDHLHELMDTTILRPPAYEEAWKREYKVFLRQRKTARLQSERKRGLQLQSNFPTYKD